MTTNNATHLTALSVLKTPSATNSPALSKMSKSIKALIHIPAISGFFDLSFDKLSNFDISYIVPLTSDISIHAELASHISQLSGTLGRERRGVVGGDNGETVSETLARARDLSSDRIQVVHGGLYDYNSSGELELYPPYILAAQHAGRVAFLEDGESATHDVYRMSSPEYKLEREDISKLLDGGCLAFEFVLGKNATNQSFVRLVQDLTTDTTSVVRISSPRAAIPIFAKSPFLIRNLSKEIEPSYLLLICSCGIMEPISYTPSVPKERLPSRDCALPTTVPFTFSNTVFPLCTD